MANKKKYGNHMTTLVIEAMDIILKKHSDAITSLYVVAVELYEFEIHRGNLIGVVNLWDKTCLMPCVHNW